MSRATRDFYFNFPVGGENCETCGASFFKGENFFLSFFLEGKSRIRFLSLEFLEKWFIEWWIAEHARMERFLCAEFNDEIWNFGFLENGIEFSQIWTLFSLSIPI